MELNEVRIGLERRNFPKGKTVSWENLAVTRKATLSQKAKSIACRKDEHSIDILMNQRGLVRPGEMLALMGER